MNPARWYIFKCRFQWSEFHGGWVVDGPGAGNVRHFPTWDEALAHVIEATS